MTTEVEVVVDAHAIIGEGPTWDDRDRVLWWIDTFRHLLHRFDPATGADRTFDIGAQIGAVMVRKSGGLILAMPDGFVAFEPETEAMTVVARVGHDAGTLRLNDGKCDPQGRFWAGSMAHNPIEPSAVVPNPGEAALYRLDPDASVHQMLDGVTVSNGLGWSPAADAFYYIDTLTFGVDVFDFAAEGGTISNRRRLITLAPDEGFPDGMCVDGEGFVWLAVSGKGEVRRYSPGGVLDGVIETPASKITSCAFGGEDLSDLYITSHSALMSEEELAAEPLSGALFRCRPGVGGTPVAAYAG